MGLGAKLKEIDYYFDIYESQCIRMYIYTYNLGRIGLGFLKSYNEKFRRNFLKIAL